MGRARIDVLFGASPRLAWRASRLLLETFARLQAVRNGPKLEGCFRHRERSISV
jgi:hypothetical protein